MMSPLDDRVMAYVDGELDAAACATFELAMAANPALQAAVQRERALRDRLAATYDPVLAEPLPQRLQQALATAPEAPPKADAPAPVFDLGDARARRDARNDARETARLVAIERAREAASSGGAPRFGAWPAWGGLAASLVLGVLIGVAWRDAPFELGVGADGGAAQALLRQEGAALMAGGELERRLERGLAADAAETAPAAGAGSVTVGLSFVAHHGGYCRSFVTTGAAPHAGLACRDGDSWVVQALAPAAPAASAATGETPRYRMAAAALPPAVLQQIDALRAGEVLDAAGERAARDAGWRR